jgi:peptidoglycan/xylan/chitin deacetylase (PgdA/CDA1 family)
LGFKEMKKMKREILNFISSIPFINKYFSGIATIFYLHRVCRKNENRLHPNENMKISPEILEQFILELKSKGYEFISLDRLYEILISGERVEKQIVFTLDDGYRDNYEIAYPIFKKYAVPFTIYLTSGFLEGTAFPWWYILEDLIIENNVIVFGNEKYSCKSKEEKEKVFLYLRERILKLDQKNLLSQFLMLFKNYNINPFEKNKELFMSWDQIVELSKDPLCIIGGHTKNHLVLRNLEEREVIKEIIEANELIESKAGKKVEHFAYPFGDSNAVGKREFEIVKKLGLKTATTTRNGNIFNEHRNYLECLPRIMLTENFRIKEIGRLRKKRIVTL